MKNKFLTMAALATVLMACSKESETIDNPAPIDKGKTEVAVQQPITFGAYVNRATTRAGASGTLVLSNPANGETSLQDPLIGFGVMAYYTDDNQYSPIYVPNFMYNTHVKYNGSAWTYEPMQYWPNETGSNAASEGVDRLSFFAYAPYVDVDNTTGVVSAGEDYGIVGLSRNGAKGDPFVQYYASLDPDKQVDFCWGVNDEGKPYLNMTKQVVGGNVKFYFNHALAALNVQVDADVDVLNPHDNTDVHNALAEGTRIYVRSVTFEGFATKGSFNLNTNKATWYDLAGDGYIDGGSVTVYDGRTNGKEGQSESVNEAPLGLNPNLVQSVPYTNSDGTPNAAVKKGVTHETVNLFNGTGAPIYVIPSGQPMNVTIVYDVETVTDELSGYLSDGVTHGTSVENKITKTISFSNGTTTSNKLEAGKKYNLTLHLGMTSVKFNATVADWGSNSEGGAGLPSNLTGVGSVEFNLAPGETPTASKWASDPNFFAPSVSAKDPEGNPMTEGVTVTWSSTNTNVVDVDPNTGEITIKGPGTAAIRATANNGISSASADYTVNVDAVTGIELNPTVPIKMGKSATTQLDVKINHSTYGTITLPNDLDITKSGANADGVTLALDSKTTSGGVTTYRYTVSSGTDDGTATVTFKLDGNPYTVSGADVTGSTNIIVAPPPTATGNGFGGWE
ncbi:MAG: Ig-like domain-containing protein [Bacteroidaceae bacterium]|nr:Ig-like domain-containing protein [Bacteroidaceae bacterium]